MTRTREALRQQLFVQALWRDAAAGELQGWTRDDVRGRSGGSGGSCARGLQAYQANARALAERALAAAYPTLQQLLGPGSFAALAAAFWQAHPPAQGDIAQWGADLAGFVAVDPQLAAEPYLGDVARLEWAVHVAHGAADGVPQPQGLELLAALDPCCVRLLPQPGTALVPSAHPLVGIWQAHRAQAASQPERFAAVRAAFNAGRAEPALVWRSGWQVRVAALTPAETVFNQAVLQGQTLAAALTAADACLGFDFEQWLLGSLRQGWLAGACVTSPQSAPCPTPAPAE